MKFYFLTLAILTLAVNQFAHAEKANSTAVDQVVQTYAEHVSRQYRQSLEGGLAIQEAVGQFLNNPSSETLSTARTVWTEARKTYSETEVFRFYSGPIDGEDGPEGALNAWPLDEAYIDSVLGNRGSGIINQLTEYPTLTKDLLRGLNERDGEKNISTGYHAIEFLLWGQDFNSRGPGQRSFTDFIDGQGRNADRRRQYLALVTEILVEDLQWLANAWNLEQEDSYGARFVAPTQRDESLKSILMGTFKLSAEELSQERMFVAYDTQLQEDEHSCFSDTTHFDIIHNYRGIAQVLRLPGVLTVLATEDASLASQIETRLDTLDELMDVFPRPFDRAILETESRKQILQVIRQLEDLGEEIRVASESIGVVLF